MIVMMVMFILQETESNLQMERSAAQEAQETSTVLERKLIAVQTELDDIRSLLEAVSINPTAIICLFFCTVSQAPHGFLVCPVRNSDRPNIQHERYG